MARRFLHHDAAFEHFLRERRIPYIAVDEARRTLLPLSDAGQNAGRSLKSFDFLVSLPHQRLIVEVKGRTCKTGSSVGRRGPAMGTRLESWATRDDVEGLQAWQRLLGGPDHSFHAAMVFLYTCEGEPADTLFDEAFHFRSVWYGLRTVLIDEYAPLMRPRSERWGTVDVAPLAFTSLHLPIRAAVRVARSA